MDYSEWDSRKFDAKYGFLQTTDSPLYSKLSADQYQILKKYQKSVSFIDALEGKELSPNMSSLLFVHPLEFLKVLKGCFIPAAPSSNVHLCKRILQYTLDESVTLLDKVITKLEFIKMGGSDSALETSFTAYFGFVRGSQNYAKATNIQIQEVKPPVVQSFETAIAVVLERFKYTRTLLEMATYEKVHRAWLDEPIAYAFQGDINYNIHISPLLYKQTSLYDPEKYLQEDIRADELFSIPALTENQLGETGVIDTFIHETMHFLLPNSKIVDQSIVSSLSSDSIDPNYKFITDIKAEYTNENGKSENFNSYREGDCKKFAKQIPYATLANADSYALFLGEYIESIKARPKIEYRSI